MKAKLKQLKSIELERKAILKVACACAEYLVYSHGKQWKDGPIEENCRQVLETCFDKIRGLRRIVRMNRFVTDSETGNDGIDADGVRKSLDGDCSWIKDISEASVHLAKERGYVG